MSAVSRTIEPLGGEQCMAALSAGVSVAQHYRLCSPYTPLHQIWNLGFSANQLNRKCMETRANNLSIEPKWMFTFAR